MVYAGKIISRRRLSDKTVELELARPEGFDFRPGQRIRFLHADVERDYSLASGPQESALTLCARVVEGGKFSPFLGSAAVGTELTFTGPHGYFIHRPAPHHSVFVATGTGVAPFVSMARSGLTDFTILHGARSATDLYNETILRSSARLYVPCLSAPLGAENSPQGAYAGRVTDYMENELAEDRYEFYLCGRVEMIRDATLLIDRRFPGSQVYTEIFF